MTDTQRPLTDRPRASIALMSVCSILAIVTGCHSESSVDLFERDSGVDVRQQEDAASEASTADGALVDGRAEDTAPFIDAAVEDVAVEDVAVEDVTAHDIGLGDVPSAVDAGASLSCEEIESAYKAITSQKNCSVNSDCKLVFEHCGSGLGGCYGALNVGADEMQMADLARRWSDQGCTRWVCSCSPPPAAVKCEASRCEYDFS